MRFVLLAIAGMVLLGCGRSVHIDNSTPDLALKSWWRLLDAEQEFAHQQCLTHDSGKQPLAVHANEILTGEAASGALGGPSCVQRVYDRRIEEVKMESGSRAWIIATIKNVTPIPSDIHLPDFDKKERQSGGKFKYLFEREGDGEPWKLSQAFRGSEYGEDWLPLYDPKTANLVSYSFIF